MRKNLFLTFALMGIFVQSQAAAPAGDGKYGKPVRQEAIGRVEAMPDLPESYRMIDWKSKARSFDAYIFNWHNDGKLGPFIWLDNHRRNVDQTTFGLYTAVADVRQGPNHNNGEFHEALTSLSAILGAGLVGIDKTSQDGYNYVKMVQNYFNRDNGWNIMMNNTNRLFFPGYIDADNQWAAEYKDITHNQIAYEGLRKADDYGMHWLQGVSPVAIGDGPKWIAGNPTLSMFSVYSTAPIGILGAIVDTTDVRGILRLDCNATDFYASRPYPAYLVYNPYPMAKSITWKSSGVCDLFDVVAKEYVARGLRPGQRVSIPAKGARVVYELPAGTRVRLRGDRIIAGRGNVILYGARPRK